MTETARLVLAVDSTDVDRGASSLDKIGRQAQTTEGQTTRATDQITGGFKVMGAAIAAVAGSAALRKIVDDLASFDQAMRGVQAVSGATVEQMAALEEQARTLGATSIFSAQQSAEAQKFLAQAGFEVNEVMSATPGILELAAAAGMDLGTAADLASNALSGFRLEAEEIGRVNDVLASTAASANTDVMQLGQALSFAAPIATTAGISIEQAAAAIGALSDSGIQASRAGTGFVGFIRQLSNLTPQAADALESYGISLEQVDITTQGLQPVIERLAEANITTADAFKIFGSEAGAAAQVLLGSSERVSELTTTLSNAEGAASEMASILGGGLTGSMKAFSSASAEAILQLGDGGIGGSLESLIDTATGVISVYNGMLPQFAEANDLSVEQAANLENLAGAIQVIAAAAGGYATYTLAVKGATVAMVAFNAATRANPVGLAVSGIAAAAAAISAFGGGTDDASIAVAEFRREIDQTAPSIDKMVDKYEELNEVQREGLRIEWAEQQRVAAQAVEAAFYDLQVAAQDSLEFDLFDREGNRENIASLRELSAEMIAAREEGESLLPLVDGFAEANGLSPEAADSLRRFVVEMDKAESKALSFERVLSSLGGTAASTFTDAAESARFAAEILSEMSGGDAASPRPSRADTGNTDAIQKRIDALNLEAQTLGMTATQADLYKLSVDGATQSQIRAAEQAYATIDAYDAEKDAIERNLESRRVAAEIVAEMEAERQTKIDAGEQLLEQYMAEEEMLRVHHENQLEILENAKAADFDNEAKWNEAILSEHERFEEAMTAVSNREQSGRVQAASNMLSQMSGMMSSKYRALFEIGKAAALANVAVMAPEKAEAASKWGMTLGGPPLAAAFTAASYVVSAAHAAQIASTSFGGGSSGIGSVGGSSGSYSGGVNTVPAAPAPVQLGGSGGGGVTINFQGDVTGLDEDALTDALVGKIGEQINDLDYVLIERTSRQGRELAGN